MARVKKIFLVGVAVFLWTFPLKVSAHDSCSGSVYYCNSIACFVGKVALYSPQNNWDPCFSSHSAGNDMFFKAQEEGHLSSNTGSSVHKYVVCSVATCQNGTTWDGSGSFSYGSDENGSYIISDATGDKLYEDGQVEEAEPGADDQLDDFINDGVTLNEDGSLGTPVPSGDLPLDPVVCGQFKGEENGVKCQGWGPSGEKYESWLNDEWGDPSDVKNWYSDRRDEGSNIWDERDNYVIENGGEVYSGDPFSFEIDQDAGFAGNNGPSGGGGGSLPDMYVYFPPNEYNGDSYEFSDDLCTLIGGCGDDWGIGPFGGDNPDQNIIDELIDWMLDNGPWSPDPCINGRVLVSDNLLTMRYADSHELLGSITLTGRPLDGVDRGVIGQSIQQNPNIGDCTVVVAGEDGDGAGDGVELPGGDAEDAPEGKTGSTELGEDGFYIPVYPEGTSFSTIAQAHYSTWNQEPFIQAINGFVPTNMGNSLPSFSFETNSFGTIAWDFNDYSGVFDMMGYIVLICSTYMGIRIIITRGGE